MLPRKEEYHALIDRLFIRDYVRNHPGEVEPHILNFTFQVTDACNLRCTYCYQGNKQDHYMDWPLAKRTIDFILAEAENPDSFFSYKKNFGIVLEFIGGEPLLNIDLIEKIIEYFEQRLVDLNSPWLYFHRYSIGTNGVLFFDEKVQNLFHKHLHVTSMAVTLDGTKELHDACRIFPDGSGSYKYAEAAALELLNKYGVDSTKITISPDNVNQVFNGFKNMIELGYHHIHGNCVFENVWSVEHAKIFYKQIKDLADYILDNDLFDKLYIALFEDSSFKPHEHTDNKNFCGGTGKMLAIDYKGDFYPCIRYMESSLNGQQKPLCVGNLDRGVYCAECDKCIFDEFEKVTRTSQSSQECIDCKISYGCSWCSAYNYQETGSFNKRVMNICIMHKARALANIYFWGKAKQLGYETKFRNFVSDEIALEIISPEEWAELQQLIPKEV